LLFERIEKSERYEILEIFYDMQEMVVGEKLGMLILNFSELK
jgi:hypothetical protein